jgi:hypothetical protein
MSVSKRIGVQGNRLRVGIDGATVVLPASERPLEEVPHITRAYFEEVERAGFETLMEIGGGCSKTTVYNTLEDALRPYTGTDPTPAELACPEAENVRKMLPEIAAIVAAG